MKILLSLCLLCIIAMVHAEAGSAAGDEITKELYVPSTIKPETKAPLIVMLHGSGRNGITLVEKWKDYAKKEGIILAGPDALNLRGWGSPQDGPDYLRELVEEI